MEHRGPRPVALSFDYLDAGRRTVSFNLYDEARNRWIYDVADLVRCGSGRWLHAQLPMDELPRGVADTGTIELSPVVSGDDFAVRNLRVLEGRTTHRPGCRAGPAWTPGRLRRGAGERRSRVSVRLPSRTFVVATAISVLCALAPAEPAFAASTAYPPVKGPPPRTTCRISTIVDRRVAISCSVGRARAHKRYVVQIGRTTVARGIVAVTGRFFARFTLKSRLTRGTRIRFLVAGRLVATIRA